MSPHHGRAIQAPDNKIEVEDNTQRTQEFLYPETTGIIDCSSLIAKMDVDMRP